MRTEILGVERRRRWGDDEKARIVSETLAPGATVSEVARRNDVCASVVFGWRRKVRVTAPVATPFLPVAIGERSPSTSPSSTRRRADSPDKARAGGVIEIDLGDGRRVKVGSDVDGDALSRVLDALLRR